MCAPEPDEKHRAALNKNVARSAAGPPPWVPENVTYMEWPELPPVTDVKRVHLEPGDVVVVRLSRRLEPGDLVAMRETLRGIFAGHQVLVLSDEADLEVMRKGLTSEQFAEWKARHEAGSVSNDLDGICGG